MNKKLLLTALLILGTAFWGISFSVTKMAVGGLSQSTFLLYRFLLATLVLSVAFYRQLKNTGPTSIVQGIMLAILLTASINFSTLGIKYAPASQCAFVAGTGVILIPVLKLLIYKKQVEMNTWLAAAVALAGLFIVSVRSDFTVGVGDMYTVIATFGFAFYLIRVEKFSASGNIVHTIVPMFATCTLIMFCIAMADSSAEWLPERRSFWIGVIYCALFSTAYVYTVSNVAQRYISAEKVAIIYLFEPIFAAVASVIILGETLSWRLLVGGSLIFAGTLISEINWAALKKSDRIAGGPEM
ncbi:DMT family transporter [Dyadobacter sp. 676]|uniref:DMT family transporter n=1 Tax=Dyadobacter sp. 676 TaxID=3088362 RepID=A0AAU8FJR2_9BACT